MSVRLTTDAAGRDLDTKLHGVDQIAALRFFHDARFINFHRTWIDAESPRKELSEVATRKRSAYIKRYEFLDRFQSNLATQFALYMERLPVTHDNPFELTPQTRIAQHSLGRRERRRTSSAIVAGAPGS
jgi:hypothetical protein